MINKSYKIIYQSNSPTHNLDRLDIVVIIVTNYIIKKIESLIN